METAARLVYVLTLNWNGKQWLGDCVSSALAMNYPNFRVVVVDNGSTDDSVNLVRKRFPQVHVIQNKQNLGYPAGFNVGMAYAHVCGAEYFLLVNNDTVIDSGALRALVATAESKDRAGFVSGKVYFHDRPTILQTVGKTLDPVFWSGHDIGENEKDGGQFDMVEERDFLDDIYILVSKQLYEDVGGYDPQLFLQCEGFDWQIRAKKKSWRLYFTPEAKIWHRSGQSMGGRGSPISEYYFVRNHLIVVAKHGGGRRFILAWYNFGISKSLSVVKRVVGIVLGRKAITGLNARIAGWLGWVAGTMWVLFRQPAAGIPKVITWLSKHK
jgi:GT2 family glycosyltransferase